MAPFPTPLDFGVRRIRRKVFLAGPGNCAKRDKGLSESGGIGIDRSCREFERIPF